MPDGTATAPLEFLSQEWVSAFAEVGSSLPERPGATAIVSTVVTGGPDGPKAERSWRFELRDGRVASAAVGAAAAVETDNEAALAVAQPWDDALAALQGTVPLDESFMRGSTKIVGSTGLLLDLLPVLRSDEWRAACESVAARTTA